VQSEKGESLLTTKASEDSPEEAEDEDESLPVRLGDLLETRIDL